MLVYARAGTPLPVASAKRAPLRALLLRKAARWEKRLPPSMRRTARDRLAMGRNACPRPNRARAYQRIWTPRLRRHFLEGLAATGNVRRIARTLGVHHTSFYRRRRADPCFAVQWKQAMKIHINTVIDQLMIRAAFGWEEEMWYRNEHLGTRRVFDHRMAMQLVQFVDKRDREDRLEAAALRAETARIAENIMGRGSEDGGGISPNHALMLDLMHRHRNRHPHEWDGDVHRASGFDFTDWEQWMAHYDQRKIPPG